VPSVTLDLSPTFTGSGVDIGEGDELIARFLAAAFPAGQRLAAINFNHYAWWFWPHRLGPVTRPYPEVPYRPGPDGRSAVWEVIDPFPVHPFPNGDYSIFVSPHMRSGTFGHPWARTLCVFGAGPIAAARALTAYWPVRRRRS
jgi:uncharacterized protein DUF2716